MSDEIKLVSIEPYNTNNDWGFGGGIGLTYTFSNGYCVDKGKAYYRHLPSEKYTNYYIPIEEDYMRKVSVKEFIESVPKDLLDKSLKLKKL